MNNNFNLPKNIKQIGTLDENLKIYIEDYAFTFMQQYSKENKNEDKIAILAGEECNIDGSDVLFISAVIKPKYTIFENGMAKLTEKSFDYIQEQIDTYFPSLKILGWFYSRVGFENEISQSYIDYHKETFFVKNKVLFLNDPTESFGSFFKFCEQSESFKEAKGFIIYYERNEAMSEYMIKNQPLSTPDLDEKKEKEARLKKEEKKKIKTEQIEAKETKKLKELEKKEVKKAKANLADISLKQSKRESEEFKKYKNFFGYSTAALLLVCFVMGAGLIQNEDRISQLEERLVKVDEAYKYLLLQVKNDSVQSVFAQSEQEQPAQNDAEKAEEKGEEKTEAKAEEKADQAPKEQAPKEQAKNQATKAETELVQHETSYDKLNKKDQSQAQALQEKGQGTYVIKDGDNLEKISRQFYGNTGKISEIMAINSIEDANKIYSGMLIKLP